MASTKDLLAFVWLAMAALMTTATTTTSTTAAYRVRGVVTRTRQERAVQAANSAKRKLAVKARTYPPPGVPKLKFTSTEGEEATAVEGKGEGPGRADDLCNGEARSRSDRSKAKARSGEAARSGVSGKSRRRNRERRLKRKFSKSDEAGGRSGSAECKSARTKSGASENGVPPRVYPPPKFMAASDEEGLSAKKGGPKKGASGESGSVLAASAEGCARSGSGSKKGSKKRRTRGLKSGGKGVNGSGRSVEDGCVESVSGSGIDSGKSIKAGQSAAKAKSNEAPDREYLDVYGTVESATAAENGGSAATTENGASNGVTAPGTPTSVLPVQASAVSCQAIANGKQPEGNSLMQQLEISADMNVRTSDSYTIDDFYEEYHAFLQDTVALAIAGCGRKEEDVQSTKVTGIEFMKPYSDLTKQCQAASGQSAAIVWTQEQPEAQWGGNKRTARNGQNEAPGNQLATEHAAVGQAQSQPSCYHILVPVNIFHAPSATDREIELSRGNLQYAINNAFMAKLEGVKNGQVSNASASSNVSASKSSLLASEVSGGQKIGVAVAGMVGFLLVAVIAMKVACNRRRKESAKLRSYSDIRDDQTDDNTFVYPTEDELLGPEFGDLEFDENRHNGTNEAKGSAYILDDLQDGMSVETGSSYDSSKAQIGFRKVAQTPQSIHRKGCC